MRLPHLSRRLCLCLSAGQLQR
eukprot:COSAG06_NODE_16436_length_1001_cov_40.018182_2_plen_21_part_01